MSKYRTDKIRPVSDDSALEETEAHGARWGGIRSEDDDTEGHRIYNTSDRTAKHEVQDVAWDDDDTDAHGFRMGATPQDDDTEGHGRFNV